MRHGWTTKTLGELILPVATIDPTKAPDRSFEYVDVSSVCNETFQVRASTTILGCDAPSRARRQIKAGDVIFATVRPTLKRIAIVPPHLEGEVCSTGYFVFRTKAELDARFLFYHLLTSGFMGAMEQLQAGASYPAVNDSQVRQQQISFPPLTEQKRIVAILDQAFAAIATASAHAQKNLANARELFDNELDAIVQAEWDAGETVSLSHLATDITDGDHLPPPKSADGVPFITIGNIIKATRRIDFSDTFKVPRAYFDGLKPNRRPRKGDVLYTVTGSFGIPVIVDDEREFCFQRHIGLIRPRSDVDTTWLYYVLSSPRFFKQASEQATGTAQKTVSLKVLRGLKAPDVPLQRQRAASQRLKVIADRTQSLASVYERKLVALGELKQSILHKAFSGELTAARDLAKEAQCV